MNKKAREAFSPGRTGQALVLCFAVLALSFGLYASAQSRYEELKQNIENREAEIERLEREISEYQNQLGVVGTQKKTLQNAVKELDLTRAKLAKDIQLTEKKIARAEDNLKEIARGIGDKEDRIEKNRDAVGGIIREIDRADHATLVEILLSHNSISEFLREADELERAQASVRDTIRSLEGLRDELLDSQEDQKNEKKTLERLSDQLGDQRAIADAKRREQNALLAETKNKESNYAKLLSDSQARKKQFEKEIADFETQLRAEIDPNSFPTPGTKVLAIPVDPLLLTQKFGKTSDARRLYTSGTHNGIDVRAPVGTPVRAALDGVVVGVGDTDKACRGASYGKWVLIQHRNGLSTLYAHLDLIKVSEGQSVNIGGLIGYAGSTGYATGPHLHFTVLVTSALQIVNIPSKSCKNAVFRIPAAPANGYLDPEVYL